MASQSFARTSFRIFLTILLSRNSCGTIIVTPEQKFSKTQGSLDASLVGDGLEFTNRGAAFIGDINRDGTVDIALGQSIFDLGAGAVLIVFLDADGIALSTLRLSLADANINAVVATGLGASDKWGSAVFDLGDLNGDGIPDMAVGAVGHSGVGGISICFLDSGGTVTSSSRISNSAGRLVGTIPAGANFGAAIGNLGDLDSDGVIDIIVGAPYDGEVRGIHPARRHSHERPPLAPPFLRLLFVRKCIPARLTGDLLARVPLLRRLRVDPVPQRRWNGQERATVDGESCGAIGRGLGGWMHLWQRRRRHRRFQR
jgi:hypothetical protein